MPDLHELLRMEFRDQVDGEAPSPDLDTRVRRRVRRARIRHRRAARAAALVLVAAAVAPVAWLVSRDDGRGGSNVTAGGDAADPADDPALAGVTYLVPTVLPEGLELRQAAGGLHPGEPEWAGGDMLVRVYGGGVVRAWRDLWPGDPDPLEQLGPFGVPTTVGGAPAVAAPHGHWLAFVDDGVLNLYTRTSGSATIENLRSLAAGDTPVLPPSSPGDDVEPGVHLAQGSPTGITGTNPRVMTFADGEGRVLTLTVVDVAPGSNRDDLAALGTNPVRGGHGALWTNAPNDPMVGGLVAVPDWSYDDGPFELSWMESDTLRVTLVGIGLTGHNDLFDVAEGLKQVDAGTWASYLGPHGPGDPVALPEPAPTTTVPPTTAVTLPPAPAGAQRLTGASHGTQEWHQTDGHCPDLDHTQDETVTMTDGAAWQFHAEYCGDVEGTQWHGDGTFGLTDPGGDSLTGTISVGWLTMGTSGSPRLITITGGTGAWGGATGTCLVDETVQVSSFTYNGTAVHDGTFTCDVSLSP